MLIRLFMRLVVLAVIIAVVAAVVPGIHVQGGAVWYLWLALIWAAVNTIIGPILRLLSLPVIVVTLGLFLIVINAAVLGITAAVSSHLSIDSFGSAVMGGILISLFSWGAELLAPARRARAPR